MTGVVDASCQLCRYSRHRYWYWYIEWFLSATWFIGGGAGGAGGAGGTWYHNYWSCYHNYWSM